MMVIGQVGTILWYNRFIPNPVKLIFPLHHCDFLSSAVSSAFSSDAVAAENIFG